MLKSDKVEKFNWSGNRHINIIINDEYKTVKIGDYFFPSIEELNLFINTLSDISDKLSEEVKEWILKKFLIKK